MAARTRVFVTGTGAVCAAGRDPQSILGAIDAGRCAIAPIESWDTSGWPVRNAGEVKLKESELRQLVPDRKLLKLIRRTDVFGIYAATQALEASGLPAWRDALDEGARPAVDDRTGVIVGSGSGTYAGQYDYFPLMTEAKGDLGAFGRELSANVNPMWLLRTLPNNVLCHVGINFGLKGTNACITNHSVSGLLAAAESLAALRAGEADRIVAIGHDAPIEPQTALYYHGVGLVASERLLPFDAARDGSLFGEGAAAVVLETEAAARERAAPVLGELLGSGYAAEGEGLLPIREDGDGLVRAIRVALADAELRPDDVGMIVAHANGTRPSDASEAAAIRAVFGDRIPPVTGFKWAFGHLLAASGMLDLVVALAALGEGRVPGIATLARRDPALGDFPVSRQAVAPRSPVALVLSRGFAGTDAALLVTVARAR
jgi:3-oxoacyl-[acyl-carrier-protein] synthase-1